MFTTKDYVLTTAVIFSIMMFVVHSTIGVRATRVQSEHVQLISQTHPELKSAIVRIRHSDGKPFLSRLEYEKVLWMKKRFEKKGRFLNLVGIPLLIDKFNEVIDDYSKHTNKINRLID